ncbi:chemotaxis protein CheA [Povalibacter sp.]|uniref:chemotaxis protein CheA n=1 Tax=Povalibacter sp. TaxID=1962978 RepID=UPI002F4080ED
MNEFIEQFILESRDLVEQATAALSILEKSPQDPEALDAVLRAFHTLKGGAGIVDFAAMERAVHAAEDALSHSRAADHAVTARVINDCLACLDQVVRWLDLMEQSGEVVADADAQADALIARLVHSVTNDRPLAPAIEKNASASWSNELLKRNPGMRQQAKTAVRFIPPADSFFRGEDPMALIAALPGLLMLEAEPVGEEWPTLDALDPFESILVLTALTGSTGPAVRAHLEGHAGECEVVALAAAGPQGSEQALTPTSRDVLKAQLVFLDSVESRTFIGRVASAGRVASNVLRYCGLGAQADLIAHATRQSLDDNSPRALREQIARALEAQAPLSAAPTSQAPSRPEALARTLRVDAERVDALIRLTGELTVVRNAIGHAVKLAQADTSSLAGTLKKHYGALDNITSELQSAVLGMRVLPLRTVLQRFPRMVREISADLAKPAKLLIEGDETEADKAIVEMLFEPLLHIVRNAMDHGIEDAAVRARKNKPAIATLRMRASRQGDRVLIEVDDDGNGVDIARVRQVALEGGIATVESLDAMSEAEIVDLVFAPGFSTAASVTELSGRGVGMDAVRTAVGRVGGRVSMESRYGQGTTVRFTLPFSVMMSHVMTVEAGGQMFGIPLDAVVESIRVPIESIACIGAAQAIVHRNHTLPVFELARVLRVREEARDQEDAAMIIATFGGQLGGIRVDRIGEPMEVMLRPLDGLLSGIPGLAGTTILGDGRVLLVLDLDGVIQ